MQATAPSYSTPNGSHTECFGRQIVDIPSESTFYWAILSKASDGGFENLSQRFNDRTGRGNIEIETKELLTQFAVYGPITEELRKFFFSYRANSNEALLRNLGRALKVLQEREKLFRQNPPGPNTMANLGAEIAATKKSIADLKADQYRKSIDLGRADSLAFRAELKAAKPYLHGAVVLGEHIVAFQSMLRGFENYVEPTEAQWVAAESAIRKLINQLEPRGLYEIPKDRGFCLPYAFLRDDGTYGNKISTSFRFADSPAVIYTLSVASIPGGGASETTILNATGRSSTGILSQLPENTTVKQRLGPRPSKIGALTSEQGGIVVETKRQGHPPLEGYHVYTGYAGWAGSQILPTIEVTMESAARAAYPRLATDAPPYEQARPRLDALLKSIRLRPTTPPMPELVGIQ
ncbi:T6SS immunity protein Tli4 family protein [Cupriavidus alkaliphilus]|uniref:T6SS immunity protein Tli4 family protein n=1 Tax=Cupriavidus alkaliphilus TaxID=942866 RepID=UPI001FC9BE01|nr:T6SS immunity protein Tli4 family protein [Cupriavidus alkaliphilus]